MNMGNIKIMFWKLVMVAVLIAVASVAVYGDEKDNSEKFMRVTVEKFIKDFKSNKLAAEDKYFGKVIEITGPVKSVEKSAIRKRLRVTFAKDTVPLAGVVISDIDCYFPDDALEQLKELEAGKKVTIRGLCKNSDTFENCEVVK